MHKDQLENFIIKNRQAFDDKPVPSSVWNGIEKNIKPKKKIKILKIGIWSVAASICMLVAFIFFMNTNTEQKPLAANSDLIHDLPEIKNYYSSQVANKYKELKQFGNDENIQDDLEQSNNFLQELEEELKDVAPSKRDEVIEAMIKNYQYKLLMLERVIEEIKKSKNLDDEKTISI